MAHREASIYSDYTQQIRHLIVDAVDKINTQFLTSINEDDADVTIEKGHTSNLLNLLHKALDISKMLNNKINAVMHAIQIEDIAGQVIDEVFHRINLNLITIKSVQEKISGIADSPADQKLHILKSIQDEIAITLGREKRNHVSQKDLNEGSTELF